MKKPTPKRKQPRSYSKSRHHTFEMKTRRQLFGKVALMQKLNRLGKLNMPKPQSSEKITTVKA